MNKAYFLESYKQCNSPILAVAVRLPSGAVEVIVNTQDIAGKMAYYDNAYDDELKLKANSNIEIEGWTFASKLSEVVRFIEHTQGAQN